ncbi:MAG: hypothetical protein Q8O61_12655 [Nocardioides sp.]|nr:hypothetical protein [Nocardioides sp.]
MTTYLASRVTAAASAAYGAYCLAKPQHLGQALNADLAEMPAYRDLAYTYGGRDLAISLAILTGRSPATVRTGVALRIAMDLTDCATLAASVGDRGLRTKVMAITLGWAALNGAALLLDERD